MTENELFTLLTEQRIESVTVNQRGVFIGLEENRAIAIQYINPFGYCEELSVNLTIQHTEPGPGPDDII